MSGGALEAKSRGIAKAFAMGSWSRCSTCSAPDEPAGMGGVAIYAKALMLPPRPIELKSVAICCASAFSVDFEDRNSDRASCVDSGDGGRDGRGGIHGYCAPRPGKTRGPKPLRARSSSGCERVMMPLFVRIFLLIAAALVAFAVLAFLIKILVVAAVLAALVVGGLMVVGAFRRRLPGRAYPIRRV